MGHFLFPWALLIAQFLAGAEIFPLRRSLGYRVAAGSGSPNVGLLQLKSRGVASLDPPASLVSTGFVGVVGFRLSECVDCHDRFDITRNGAGSRRLFAQSFRTATCGDLS